MTNKEALNILTTTPFWSVFPQDVKDALNIALVALEEVDNAPTVETGHYLTNCQNCKSDYSRGYDDGYVEGYKDGMTGADMRGCDL